MAIPFSPFGLSQAETKKTSFLAIQVGSWRALSKTRKEVRALCASLLARALRRMFHDSPESTAMQKADGVRLFQFKICLWFLLGWGAADGAVRSGGENAPDAVAGQVKSGEWKVESLREGEAPFGRKGEGRREEEEGRCARCAGGRIRRGRGWKAAPPVRAREAEGRVGMGGVAVRAEEVGSVWKRGRAARAPAGGANRGGGIGVGEWGAQGVVFSRVSAFSCLASARLANIPWPKWRRPAMKMSCPVRQVSSSRARLPWRHSWSPR